MFEFLSKQNTDHPTFIAILLTVMFSFVLSSLIAFTYDQTSRGVERPLHYIQSLILISIVAATVMQAIGDSLARGLGMLGALAIIRFRTTLRDPRNMVFMFASIAVGIASGVFGYVIAVTGTVGFCLSAFIIRFSPFSKKRELLGAMRIEIEPEQELKDKIIEFLDQHCSAYELRQYKIVEGKKGKKRIALNYKLKVKNGVDYMNFSKAFDGLQGIRDVQIRFNTISEIESM